jgi:flavin reductase (DIM6/NTAB) family NADH-FMN oxidoreductase RutF
MRSIEIKPSTLYFGTTVVLITTLNVDGSTNITPISSAWALADRMVLGMADAGMGCENLLRTGECVINIPSAAQWQAVEAIGRTTGRNPVPDYKQAMGYRYEADTFSISNLSAVDAVCVKVPRIADCPIQMETRLLASHPFSPDVDSKGVASALAVRMIEVQVLKVHAHEELVIPNTQRIDTQHWNPLLYIFRHYVGASNNLGSNFRAD